MMMYGEGDCWEDVVVVVVLVVDLGVCLVDCSGDTSYSYWCAAKYLGVDDGDPVVEDDGDGDGDGDSVGEMSVSLVAVTFNCSAETVVMIVDFLLEFVIVLLVGSI